MKLKNNYKSQADSPKELNISTYWVGDYRGLLREGLPKDHPENLYNWFTKTYPDLNPEFYEIKNPNE